MSIRKLKEAFAESRRTELYPATDVRALEILGAVLKQIPTQELFVQIAGELGGRARYGETISLDDLGVSVRATGRRSRGRLRMALSLEKLYARSHEGTAMLQVQGGLGSSGFSKAVLALAQQELPKLAEQIGPEGLRIRVEGGRYSGAKVELSLSLDIDATPGAGADEDDPFGFG